MADIEYSVVAKLQAQGAPQFKGDMGAAAQAASKLQDGLKGMGAHLYEFGAGAIGAAAKVTSIAAAMGTAAAVAAAGYIGKNLSLLEDKSIQMGAVIGAATSTSFQAAKRESDVLFEKFKKMLSRVPAKPRISSMLQPTSQALCLALAKTWRICTELRRE